MALEEKVRLLRAALEEIRECCFSDDQYRAPARTSLEWSKKSWAKIQAIAAENLRATET